MRLCEIARIWYRFSFAGPRGRGVHVPPAGQEWGKDVDEGRSLAVEPAATCCRRDTAVARLDPARLHTMSAISTDEVARVAALARVALSDEEVSRLAGELDAVASSFARVTSVVSPDLPATSHPVPLTNVLREDVPAPTLDVDELLAGAPASEDSMFLVPQILGEDSAS